MTDYPDVLAALLRQDLAAANAGLVDCCGLRGRLTVEQVDNGRSIEAAPVWRIEEDGTSRFRFCSRSWRNRPDLIFSRWMTMLPMIAAVIEARRPGRCWFSLGDEAHRPGLAFCGNMPEHVPVPDPYFMASVGYRDLAAAYARHDVSWAIARQSCSGEARQPALTACPSINSLA